MKRVQLFRWSMFLCYSKDTMTFVLDHLKRVSLRADVNKMSTANLAVTFGPWLVCPSSLAAAGTSSSSSSTSVSASCVTSSSTVVNGLDAGQPSPSSSLGKSSGDKFERQVDLVRYLLDIWPETRGN